MSVADMCDPVEEKQIVESMMGVDDVSGTQVSKEKPSRRRCVDLERDKYITMSCEVLPKQIQKASSLECAGLM